MELHFVQLSLCNRYSVIFLPDPKSGETRNVGDNQNNRSARGVVGARGGLRTVCVLCKAKLTPYFLEYFIEY